jgi:uncharacterized protein YerC
MQTSSKPLRQTKEQTLIVQFATLLADLHNPIESEQFLRDFLTETELSVLSKRLAIYQMLKERASYQEIQTELQVSSATISSVREFHTSIGARIIEQKLTTNEWAQRITNRIWKVLPKFMTGSYLQQ